MLRRPCGTVRRRSPMCVEKERERAAEGGMDIEMANLVPILVCSPFPSTCSIFLSLSLSLFRHLHLLLQFARFNDTLVSLAGDDGIPFATSYEPSSGEECAALCASVTAKAAAAASSKKKGGQKDAAPPALPRCFSSGLRRERSIATAVGDGKNKSFTCALYGWSAGDPCPEVTIETSGGTTSFLDPKALSSSLGACAGASSTPSYSAPSSFLLLLLLLFFFFFCGSLLLTMSVLLLFSDNRNDKIQEKNSSSSSFFFSSGYPRRADERGEESRRARRDRRGRPRLVAPRAAGPGRGGPGLGRRGLAGFRRLRVGTTPRPGRKPGPPWSTRSRERPSPSSAPRPRISDEATKTSKRKNLKLSFQYLGTATDVASAAVCTGSASSFRPGRTTPAERSGGDGVRDADREREGRVRYKKFNVFPPPFPLFGGKR